MTTEQQEFIALWKASGWTKAEAARQLDLSRSAVGRFVEGKISPSIQTLKLFKLILAAEKPGALTGAVLHEEYEQTEWEKKILRALRPLHREDRDRVLRTITAMIEGLPQRPTVEYPSLSSQRHPVEAIEEISSTKISEKAASLKTRIAHLRAQKSQV